MCETIANCRNLFYNNCVITPKTGTYYLRARYYDPRIGRFTQQDTHWNTSNMIYGDNPQKINEHEDKLGLKTYSYAPQISAVVQSGNSYVYAVGNPVMYADPSGEVITESVLVLLGLAVASVILIGLTSATQGLTNDLTTSGHLTTFPTIGINKANVAERYKLGEESLVSPEISKTAKKFDDRSQRIHHIVARHDNRAAPARAILIKANIDFDDSANLVAITHKTHKSMHTKEYYKHINDEFTVLDQQLKKCSQEEYSMCVRYKLHEIQAQLIAQDINNIIGIK